MSLRDEATVKNGVYLPRTRQQRKYCSFQVENMMLDHEPSKYGLADVKLQQCNNL
jgi:hypothetical protein